MKRKYIKITLYTFIAILFVFALKTRTAETFITGVEMVLNGECVYLSNRLWGIIGFENPVCAWNNKLMQSFILALRGDQPSIALLTGYVVMILGMPTGIVLAIDQISAKIEQGTHFPPHPCIMNNDLDENEIQL